MDIRPQVFVSSTYVDLIEERQAVTKILLELECFPAGMELFPAGDEDKMDLIQSVIDDSDYYLLILSGKYGSIDPDSNLSYTEMEYDYAVKTKKPIMAFIRKDIGELPSRLVESDPIFARRLEDFKEKVRKPRNVRFYESKEDLSAQLATSMPGMRRRNKAVGWVRGDQALTPEVAKELAELRAQNAELRAERSEARSVELIPLFPDLEDGNDPIVVDLMTDFWSGAFMESQGFHHSITLTWNELFAGVAPKLIGETPAELVSQAILDFVSDRGLRSDSRPNPAGDWTPSETNVITVGFADQVIVQFLALGLIGRGTKPRDSKDFRNYWMLTPAGEDRMLQLRARRKPSSEVILNSATERSQ